MFFCHLLTLSGPTENMCLTNRHLPYYFLQGWRLACHAREIWRNTLRVACTPPSTAATGSAAEINFAVIKRNIAGRCDAVVVCCCCSRCCCWTMYLSIHICHDCCNAMEGSQMNGLVCQRCYSSHSSVTAIGKTILAHVTSWKLCVWACVYLYNILNVGT